MKVGATGASNSFGETGHRGLTGPIEWNPISRLPCRGVSMTRVTQGVAQPPDSYGHRRGATRRVSLRPIEAAGLSFIPGARIQTERPA